MKEREFKLSGHVVLYATDISTGIRKKILDNHNLIVNDALLITARLLSNIDAEPLTHIGFGTSNIPPAITDSSLSDAYMKEIDGSAVGSDDKSCTFMFSLDTSEDNGVTISEIGLFTASETLFARRVLDVPIEKTENIAFDGTWTINIAQSENQ